MTTSEKENTEHSLWQPESNKENTKPSIVIFWICFIFTAIVDILLLSCFWLFFFYLISMMPRSKFVRAENMFGAVLVFEGFLAHMVLIRQLYHHPTSLSIESACAQMSWPWVCWKIATLPVILWIKVGGRQNGLSLNFGYHDEKCTGPNSFTVASWALHWETGTPSWIFLHKPTCL